MTAVGASMLGRAFYIIAGLVVFSWTPLLWGGSAAVPFVGLAAGSAVALIGCWLPRGYALQAWKAGRKIAPLFLLPILLIAFQCLPITPLANPIWKMTSGALHQ